MKDKLPEALPAVVMPWVYLNKVAEKTAGLECLQLKVSITMQAEPI